MNHIFHCGYNLLTLSLWFLINVMSQSVQWAFYFCSLHESWRMILSYEQDRSCAASQFVRMMMEVTVTDILFVATKLQWVYFKFQKIFLTTRLKREEQDWLEVPYCVFKLYRMWSVGFRSMRLVKEVRMVCVCVFKRERGCVHKCWVERISRGTCTHSISACGFCSLKLS